MVRAAGSLVALRLVALRLLALMMVALMLATSASAHRLDEYLQATLLGLTRTGVDVELQLTPGLAVFPSVLPLLDRNLDGRLSPDEETSYAQWVAKDLELVIDGEKAPLRVVEMRFSSLQEMHEGLGSIRLKLHGNHAGTRLAFRNQHLPELSAYLVNCLAAPGDGLTVGRQERDEAQRSIGFVYSFEPLPGKAWISWLVGLGAAAAGGRVLLVLRRHRT